MAETAQSHRARRRRDHVLPVAAVPRGQREVPLGDAPPRRHRDTHLARGDGSRRAPRALLDLPAPGRDARVALVFDWENWWAVEERDHPAEIDYLALSLQWYGALHERGIMVDIVPPERVDDGYDLVDRARPCTCCATRAPRR